MAQVEFIDVLRRITQTIQSRLNLQEGGSAQQPGGTGGRPTLHWPPPIGPSCLMAHWLLKTEPDCYAWDDLFRDKRTVWDGVTNSLALKHIRAMKKGDARPIYHTGDERAAVGVAEITSAPIPTPGLKRNWPWLI